MGREAPSVCRLVGASGIGIGGEIGTRGAGIDAATARRFEPPALGAAAEIGALPAGRFAVA